MNFIISISVYIMTIYFFLLILIAHLFPCLIVLDEISIQTSSQNRYSKHSCLFCLWKTASNFSPLKPICYGILFIRLCGFPLILVMNIGWMIKFFCIYCDIYVFCFWKFCNMLDNIKQCNVNKLCFPGINVVHWRREWQTTSALSIWEPHEQYEKTKSYDIERWTPQVSRWPKCCLRRVEK